MAKFSQMLAEQTKRYRTLHGLNQDQLAAKIRSNKATVCGIENGKRLPRREVLDRLWDLLHPEVGSVAETEPSYGQVPYLQWLREIIDSDASYHDKIRHLHNALDIELARLENRKGGVG